MSNYPRHPDWEAEKELTRNKPNWKEALLARVGAVLGEWSSWADKVGYKVNEVQIQQARPIDSFFSYSPLDVLWVRFNTWDPQTKRPSTRAVRFGPPTATLMLLIKVPNGNSFEWYLLARKKYQFASKEMSTEFSRGFVKGTINNDQGWKLLERDFPGLKGDPSVVSISEQQLGSAVWENNAEHANKTSQHLIVIEMQPGTTASDIEKVLISNKLRQEYKDNYSETLGKEDLMSTPVVMPIEEAAKLLNAHLSSQEASNSAASEQLDDLVNLRSDKILDQIKKFEVSNIKPVPLAMFGEEFSISCWTKFLSLFGHQFKNLMPNQNTI